MKPSLSIGIAAYNEEANIGALLEKLLHQKIESADLQEIRVVSDASSDDTENIVRSFEGTPVKLLRLEQRSGANQVQNILMDQATSDILVVLNADILPETKSFIEGLIRPILADRTVGLTSAVLLPATPKTFFERILAHTHQFKSKMFASIGDGNNLYTCVGPARAFSRRLYTAFRYPDNVPDDAASYLFCMREKMRFVSVTYPRAIFRCPTNLRDHIKQSLRFANGKDALVALFENYAKKEYALPRFSFITTVMKESILHPIYSVSFFTIWCIARSRKPAPFSTSWDLATSSKKI